MAGRGPRPRRLCLSGALIDGGRGLRFVVRYRGEDTPAFAVRFRGRVHAYLNQCAHQSVELDWNPGEFFDRRGELLICATHGAQYVPDTGACAGGRCDGVGLTVLAVHDDGAEIRLIEDDDIYLIDVDDGA